MRIQSSTVDTHQFMLVRRRGYDPDEVDAVMSRLAETLREYEALTTRLGDELREAEESSEAIKRTFVAAQRTRDEMIAEAKQEAAAALEHALAGATNVVTEAESHAAAILEGAFRQGEELSEEARDERERAAAEADKIRNEANAIIDVAQAKADSIRTQADEVITSSMAEAESTREEATRVLRQHKAEARITLQRAKDEADHLTADARTQAERAVTEATSEAADKLATSRREAETLVASAINEAKSLRGRVKSETDEYRASKTAEADEFVTVAENEARELRAQATAESATTTARARAEAEETVKRAKADAASRVSAAQARSDEILDSAQSRADGITKDARKEKSHLDRRIVRLRSAVADIERDLQRLSVTALERVGLIGGMIDLERTSAGETDQTAVPSGPAASTGVETKVPAMVSAGTVSKTMEKTSHFPDRPTSDTTVDLTASAIETPVRPEEAEPATMETAQEKTPEAVTGLSAPFAAVTTPRPSLAPKPRHKVPEVGDLRASRDGDFSDPDGSGRPPAARPIVRPDSTMTSGGDAGSANAVDPVVDSDEPGNAGSPTIYQRRGGGIRRRLEQNRRKTGDDDTKT